MSIIFLPIKPNYAFKIIKGVKKFEFRKSNFSEKIKLAIIYASSPEKKIIGCCKVKNIFISEPDIVWENCRNYSGISEELFFRYYNKKKKAIAIEISSVFVFNEFIDPKKVWNGFIVPQSFKYITMSEFMDLFYIEPALNNWLKEDESFRNMFYPC